MKEARSVPSSPTAFSHHHHQQQQRGRGHQGLQGRLRWAASHESLTQDERSDSHPEFVVDRRRMTRGGAVVDEEGLIVARKPENPCLASTDRQNLHRELMFNQKIGRSVLKKKSELEAAMERQKEGRSRREVEAARAASRTPLERVIEERARRLQELEKKVEGGGGEEEGGGGEGGGEGRPEFLAIHARLRAKMEAK